MIKEKLLLSSLFILPCFTSMVVASNVYYQEQPTANGMPYMAQNPYMQNQNPYATGNMPAYAPQQQMPAQQPPANYQPVAPSFTHDSIISVQAVQMHTEVTLGGTVVPFKDVTLSAQVPGRIEFIAGSEGDYLEKGQVLVAIDDDDLLAMRRQALAELNNSESAMRNAQVQYSRELISPQSRNINRAPGMGMPSLFDQFFTRNMGNVMGFGNPSMDRHADLYSQGAQVSQAQSRLLRARSKLEEVDAKIRDSRAIAPFSGLIVKKLVEVGDTVQPGQPLMKFADTDTLQLKVDVPARLMPGIKQDMVVQARLDVGDKQVNAQVAQIFPMADVQRHTVTVKFDLPAGVPGGPGMYAEVRVPDMSVPARKVIMIPSTAIRWRGSLPAVYRMSAENKAELRYIRLGSSTSPGMVTVLSGLQENERILANPAPNVISGWSPGQKAK